MTIQKINNNTVISIPSNIEIKYLQEFVNYINYKSLISKSEATDEEILKLSEEVLDNWWIENKSKFIK